MTVHLPRRQLLTGLASLLAAPAVVRASSLMPVVPVRPRAFVYPADGLLVHRYFRVAGSVVPGSVVGASYHLWLEGSHDNKSWEKVPWESGPRADTSPHEG